jgi:hypothetical protein
MGYNKVYRLQHMSEWHICGYMDQFFKLYIEDYSYLNESFPEILQQAHIYLLPHKWFTGIMIFR